MELRQAEGRWGAALAELAALAFLAAAVTLFFWDAIFTPQTFFLRDHLFTYRPYRAVVAHMLQDHVLPLWSPYLFFGQPLHAVLIQVFYPTTLLHYFLPFETAFKAHIILHYYIAVFGMYACARGQRLSRIASCAAAVSWALGSFMASDGDYFNSLVTAAWSPWVIAGLVSCARSPGLVRIALTAWALCLALLGGEVETLFFAVSVACTIALCDGEDPFLRRAVRATLVFAALGVLGVALAMVQVLPTAEMISLALRGEGLSEAERLHFSLAPLTTLEVLAPKVLGNPAGDRFYLGGMAWGGGGGRAQYPYFLSIYVGVAGLCLWACGSILGRRRSTKALGLVALLAFLAMYGTRTPVYKAVHVLFPFLTSFRFPIKWFTLASLAGGLLAGHGVEELLAWPWRTLSVWRKRVWGAALAVCLAAVVLGGWVWLVGPANARYLVGRALDSGVLERTANRTETVKMLLRSMQGVGVTAALVLALVIAAAWALMGRRPRAAGWAILLVLTADLTIANADLNRIVSPEYLTSPIFQPVLKALREEAPDAPKWRIVSRLIEREYDPPEDLQIENPDFSSMFLYHLYAQAGLHPSAAIAYGLSYGNLHDPGDIYPWILKSLLLELKSRKSDADWVREYQRTSVKYVVSIEEIKDPHVKQLGEPIAFFSNHPFRLYEVEDALPRALMVPTAKRYSTQAERGTRWLSAEFDPRSEVILEGGEPLPAQPEGPFAGSADIVADIVGGKDPNTLDVRAYASRDAWLLVLDSWSPGWVATVDGVPAAIEKADCLFRAVRVPAGRHEVRFHYEPWTFRVGAIVSLVTAAFSLLLLLVPLVARVPVAAAVERVVDGVMARAWPIALVGTVVWFHLALLSPSKCLFWGDHYFAYRPYRWVISQIWKQGELPLWNPYVMFGQPLLATLIQVIYPTSLFYALLPFEYAYDMHFLFHALVAAISMYALGRRLGWAPWIAYVGALTWALGGYVVSVEEFYNVIVTAAWAPAVLWGIDRAIERPTARRIALAAIVCALCFLGGEVQTVGFTMLVGLAVWTRHAAPGSPHAGRKLAWVFGAGAAGAACIALGLLLSAFQLVPTWELVERSPRASGLLETERTKFSMSAATTVELAYPRAFGDPAGDMCYQGGALWNTPKFQVPPYLLSRYSSTVLLLLAFFGGIALPGLRLKALSGMMAVGLVMMLGKNLPCYGWIMDHIPLAGFVRYPIKFYALAALAQAVLVGEVLARLEAKPWSALSLVRREVLLAGAVVASTVLAAGGLAWLFSDTVVGWTRDWLVTKGAIDLQSADALSIAEGVLRGGASHMGMMCLVGFVLLGATVLFVRFPRSRWIMVPAMAILVAVDLSIANRGVNLVHDKAELATRPACLDLLPPGAVSQRIHSSSVDGLDPMPEGLRAPHYFDPHDVVHGHLFRESILQPYTALRYGVRYGNAFDPGRIYPREFSYVRDRWKFFRRDDPYLRWRLLTRSGIRYTFSLDRIPQPSKFVEKGQAPCLANMPLRLFEVQGAYPRAYVAAEEFTMPNLEEAVDVWLSKPFDARRSVLVEDNAEPVRGTGTARVVSERSREVVVEADAPQGGTLVLLDSYAPGWEAWIDGNPAPVIRANVLFRGVRLPRGHHIVRFCYDPASFRWGARVSISALLLAVICLAWGRGPREA